MAKRASEPQKSASPSETATCSAKSPTRVADGKMVLRVRSKEKMKPTETEETSPRPAKKKPKTAAKKKKSSKIDAKKPKKPPTAFFFFLEDFRKEFHEQNPDVKSMRHVGKACGEKWKTMTYEEKVQYYDIATEKRAEFDKAMADYIKRKESGEDRESEDYSEFEG